MSLRGLMEKIAAAIPMTRKDKPRPPPNVNWEHIWPQNETQGALSKSPFLSLPTEVMLQIFGSLSVRDLGNVSLVCRSFKMIADQDEIWKSKCNTSTKLHSKSFKRMYMDWMHEKYLRNKELEEVEAMYSEEMSCVACGLRCGPPQYPVRPVGKHRFVPIGGFHQHPNDSQDMTIELSVNVDKTARELISLLEKASQFQVKWRQSAIIQQMITRYYRFMQLKASCPHNILLVPTLDIEIVWQTHLLRPDMYRADCLRLFHRVIDHSLLTSDIEQFLKEQAFVDTCQLYQQRFGEQYCSLPSAKGEKEAVPKFVHPLFGSLKCLIPVYSYWDQSHFEFSSKSSTNDEANPFSFTDADIILDGNWLDLCKRFMQEMLSKTPISGYYRDQSDQIDLTTSAMERLKKSYERFLYMAAKYPPTDGYDFVHPTYAIDIIWHSHMQEPLKYASDSVRLVGYVIDHAPWPSVDKEKMKKSCDDTSSSWKQEFASDMSTDHLYNTAGDGYDQWSD